MTLVKRFEDLRAWQSARKLVSSVYAATRQEPFARDFGLRDQIQRAAVSTMSNIAEGFESGTDGDFSRFLAYARASAAEVQSLLYVALDAGYLSRENFETLYRLAEETKALSGGLLASIRRRSAKSHRR